MNIDQVKLSSDVFRGLLAHSFLTEHEEVLGLLYGSLSDTEILIWGSVNLIRNCKEKDRVEVDELQLSDAIHKAEEFSRSLKQATFLVGWFHSHPNITIFPSRVDLNTQRSLQSLGEHFVGLIISCFSRDASNLEKINLIAFQTSFDGKGVSIPVVLVSNETILNDSRYLCQFDSFDYLLQVHQNLIHEEKENFFRSLNNCNHFGLVFNSSLFNLAITKVLQKSLQPTIDFMKVKIQNDSQRLEKILNENNELQEKLKKKQLISKCTRN